MVSKKVQKEITKIWQIINNPEKAFSMKSVLKAV